MAEKASAGAGPTANVHYPAFGNPQTEQGDTGRGGGSGGNGSGKVEVPLKDYVDAQDEKTRAQNDARFTDIMAELRGIRENSISWRGVWGAAIATTVTIAGVVLGALSLGGDRFDGGMAASGILDPIIAQQEARDAGQDDKLDRILTAVEQIRDDSEAGTTVGQD